MLKLPVIFQHFAEHRLENKNISFLQFLDMHYMHGSPKDKDYNRDMQLPFKTANECVFSVTIAFVPLMQQISIAKPVEAIKRKDFVIRDQFIHSSYLASIWQPPKSC